MTLIACKEALYMVDPAMWTSRISPEDLFWQDNGTTTAWRDWDIERRRDWHRQEELERIFREEHPHWAEYY